MTRPPIIFLHLPKASGTTFRYIIDREYGAANVLNIPVYGVPVEEFLDRLGPARLAEYNAVVGHVPFGIARYFGPAFRYVTIVRDPVERAISRYYHILRRGPDVRQYDYIVRNRMSAVDFALSDFETQVDNGQTRLLAGFDYRAPLIPVGGLNQTHLEKALANLESISVVGTSDRFDHTLVLLRRKFGWRLPLYVKENTTKRPAEAGLTETERSAIRERNAFDEVLYRRASARLLRDCRESGAGFEIELRAFRSLNITAGHARGIARRLSRTRRAGS